MARLARDGRPVWAFEPRPGNIHCAAWVSSEEYAYIAARGYVMIDDQPAWIVAADCDERLGFLRLRFDEPYEPPARLQVAA